MIFNWSFDHLPPLIRKRFCIFCIQNTLLKAGVEFSFPDQTKWRIYSYIFSVGWKWRNKIGIGTSGSLMRPTLELSRLKLLLLVTPSIEDWWIEQFLCVEEPSWMIFWIESEWDVLSERKGHWSLWQPQEIHMGILCHKTRTYIGAPPWWKEEFLVSPTRQYPQWWIQCGWQSDRSCGFFAPWIHEVSLAVQVKIEKPTTIKNHYLYFDLTRSWYLDSTFPV